MIRATADRLAEAIARSGMTAIEVAERSGISIRMIRYYLSGQNEPGGYNLRELCRVLGVSAGWLIGIEEEDHEEGNGQDD